MPLQAVKQLGGDKRGQIRSEISGRGQRRDWGECYFGIGLFFLYIVYPSVGLARAANANDRSPVPPEFVTTC